MNEAVLIYAFNLSIIIGFVFPLLNIFTGWFGSFLGGDIDIDVDAGGKGLIPFNIMCLCLFLVVFGATGHMARPSMSTLLPTIALLGVCLLAAAFSYWALYRFVVKRLKNNDASAITFHNLRGRRGEVTLAIPQDSVGTISLQDSTGASISFRAMIDPHLKAHMPETIPRGEKVVITEVDVKNKLCYVSMDIGKITGNRNSN